MLSAKGVSRRYPSGKEVMELYNLIILVLQMYHHRKYLLTITQTLFVTLGIPHFFTVLIGLQP
jgi:hypothetical protein